MKKIVSKMATKVWLRIRSTKLQATNKLQWFKFQTEEKRFGHLKLKFGSYLGFAIWYLEFQPCWVPAMQG
jgi:hypothetical protein